MSTFWSLWVIAIVVINIGGAVWLLLANRKVEIRGEQALNDKVHTTGHAYDGIEEYDNPLPAWWFKMYLLTVVFAVVYLILYPGFGNFKGVLGWTSEGQWEKEIARAEERYGPLFAKYSAMPVEELAVHPEALKMGGRLFANNCSVCHGTDGRGSYGFPNLADDDWLYGGNPEAIKTSITNGRTAVMAAWGPVIGEQSVHNVAHYVLSLSDRNHDEAAADEGQQVFATYCTACHGQDGTGDQTVGAPNLTDEIWLYGGSLEMIKHTVRGGRNGQMPAHDELLSDDKIHLLTAYVYSLSQ